MEANRDTKPSPISVSDNISISTSPRKPAPSQDNDKIEEMTIENTPSVLGGKPKRAFTIPKNCMQISFCSLALMGVIIATVTFFVVNRKPATDDTINTFYTDKEFMKSTDAVINRNADGCSFPSLILDKSKQFISYLQPACNQHDICYAAIDALNYTIGKANPDHMAKCDSLLINGLRQGCYRIKPKTKDRETCTQLVYIVDKFMLALRRNNETNYFYKAYKDSVDRSAGRVGTEDEVGEKWRVYMETPFVIEGQGVSPSSNDLFSF